MNGLILGLACSGTAFVFLSFFVKDNQKQLAQDLEELSMKVLQDHYQINKKLKILEEELLIGENTSSSLLATRPVNQIIQSQVVALYKQGTDLLQIAEQSSLSLEQVKKILAEHSLL